MEFSPEIAVFQSAFQLLSLKVGNSLADLPKECCPSYASIISTSVEEICRGLECDLDPEESLLWQQKLHSLVLYTLVNKKYRVEEERKVHRIPVCSQLDMFSQMLPTFSCHFYFELVKQCSWGHLLLESLSCLDNVTATTLLQSALSHLRSDPVTASDTRVIAMVTEKVLSRCLCLPEPSDTLTDRLLEPLRQSRTYVQTVYPDEIENGDINEENVENHSVKTHLMVNGNLKENGLQNISEKWGLQFWEIYVESNGDLVSSILDYFDSSFAPPEDNDDDGYYGELFHSLGQIALVWYLTVEGRKDGLSDCWLVNNICPSSTNSDCLNISKTPKVDEDTANYCINYTLVEHLSKHISAERITSCLVKGLSVIYNKQKEERIKNPVNSDQNWIKIVSNLTINSAVLFRMLLGTLSQIENGTKKELSSELVEESKNMCREMAAHLENTDQEMVPIGFDGFGEDLLFGDFWQGDITLSALLWRIGDRLSQFEVCVEKLLSTECVSFWNKERVYIILQDNIGLVSYPNRVLRLMDICSSASREITHNLQQLICTAFSELPFPDQDHVAMVAYKNGGGRHVTEVVGMERSRKLQTTNIFNKITAEIDDQILRDILLLCLADPVPVIRTAVDMCVKNEDQARNFAMVLQHMYEVCSSRHPIHHPDMSLISMVIQDFLTAAVLTETEEKHFITFVTCLMQPQHHMSGEIKPSLLSPVEFLHSSILQCIHVENLRYSNCPITCKFALKVFIASLDAGCNKHCNWSEFEFEPMAVVLSLAEILHDCVALWENRETEMTALTASTTGELETGSKQAEELKMVAMDTGMTKLVVKDTTIQCLDKLCGMVHDGLIAKCDEVTLSWLLHVTKDLHWVVRLRLSSMFTACGWEQYQMGWRAAFEDLTCDVSKNLVTLLMFVGTDRWYMDAFLCDQRWTEYCISNEDIILALVQVLPNLLHSEFLSVVMFLKEMFGHDIIPIVYRMHTSTVIPLADLTALKSALHVSQLLRDVIITLTLTLDERSRSQMLQHVIQCYVPILKTFCEVDSTPRDLRHFMLCQIFHHVCDITDCLPAGTVDSTLVLLLHIVTKFKDISKDMAKVKDAAKVKVAAKVNDTIMVNGVSNDAANVEANSKDIEMAENVCWETAKLMDNSHNRAVNKKNHTRCNLKMIKNLENGMLASVTKLPDIYEEKHMLLKKLHISQV